jgi:peroxin-13
MLESTFFATQSSFQAMVGVAEQVGNVRSTISSMFSLVSIYHFFKRFIYRIRGRALPADASQLNVGAFNSFSNANTPPPINSKPLLFFIVLSVGIPWLMSKFIKNHIPHVSPKDVDFAKAKFAFSASMPGDLEFKQGDIVAILSRLDPQGQPAEWWRGRTQDGREG